MKSHRKDRIEKIAKRMKARETATTAASMREMLGRPNNVSENDTRFLLRAVKLVSRSASRARARCGLGAETRRTRCARVCTKKCDDRDSIAQPIERRATRNVDEGTLPRTGRVAFCSRARARCGPGAETIRTRCRAKVCVCSSRGVEKKQTIA